LKLGVLSDFMTMLTILPHSFLSAETIFSYEKENKRCKTNIVKESFLQKQTLSRKQEKYYTRTTLH